MYFERIKQLFTLYWLLILFIPATVLLKNVTNFLINNEFREWHVMFLWALITPISLTIVFLNRRREK